MLAVHLESKNVNNDTTFTLNVVNMPKSKSCILTKPKICPITENLDHI